MAGVVGWFDALKAVPIVVPPGRREHGPASDDPARREIGRAVHRVAGLSLAIEYCDARGWMSERTIRCQLMDVDHPASIVVDCHLRGEARTFRLDRIISAMDYRTGRPLSPEEYEVLLGSYLPDARLRPWMRPIFLAQSAARHGVFALLHLAMQGGRLATDTRDIVLDYVLQECASAQLPAASPDFLKLWIDNLSPAKATALESVGELLGDRDRFARFLPYVLRVARCETVIAVGEMELRRLMFEVREHYRGSAAPGPFAANAT